MSKLSHSNDETMVEIQTQTLRKEGYTEEEIHALKVRAGIIQEHTKTPWQVNYDTAGNTWDIISDLDGEHVAECGHVDWPPAKANAAFIVTAVNAHDALVEALEALMGPEDDEHLGWRGTAAASDQHFQCEFCHQESIDSMKTRHKDDCPILIARRALQLAKGA